MLVFWLLRAVDASMRLTSIQLLLLMLQITCCSWLSSTVTQFLCSSFFVPREISCIVFFYHHLTSFDVDVDPSIALSSDASACSACGLSVNISIIRLLVRRAFNRSRLAANANARNGTTSEFDATRFAQIAFQRRRRRPAVRRLADKRPTDKPKLRSTRRPSPLSTHANNISKSRIRNRLRASGRQTFLLVVVTLAGARGTVSPRMRAAGARILLFLDDENGHSSPP